MNKVQYNRKANKKIIGRNVFVNINNGDRFLTVDEIRWRSKYSVIVENGDAENCYFCDSYDRLMELLVSCNQKAKITVK